MEDLAQVEPAVQDAKQGKLNLASCLAVVSKLNVCKKDKNTLMKTHFANNEKEPSIQRKLLKTMHRALKPSWFQNDSRNGHVDQCVSTLYLREGI